LTTTTYGNKEGKRYIYDGDD